MMSEASVLQSAEDWIRHPVQAELVARSLIQGSAVADQGEIGIARRLLDISQVVDRFVNESSQTVLLEASELFDELCETRIGSAEFGERYEILIDLAFVAWRDASRLGLEFESQEWIRIVERLCTEQFTWAECLKTFLALDDSDKSDDLCRRFLGETRDAFVALAILNESRFRDPSGSLRSAQRIYMWILANPDVGGPERPYLLGESARVAGNSARYLRRLREAHELLICAREHFEQAASNGPLLARVDANLLVYLRDANRHEESLQRSASLIPVLTRYGLRRDELALRLNIVAALVALGRGEEAISDARYLVSESKNADPVLCASALDHVGLCLSAAGNDREAAETLREAFETGREAGDMNVVAYASGALGEIQLKRGNWLGCAQWFAAGIRLLEEAGAVASLAYFRVYVADALIAGGKFAEAAEQLMLARPVLQSEGLVPEGIHAAKLLAVVASHLGDRYMRNLMDRASGREG